MNAGRRWAALAVLIVVAVGGFAIAKSGGGSDKTTKGVVHVVVKNAKPVGGIKKITVNKGQRVRFDVTSDVADEIHVHGYNFHKAVAKGGSVSFDFPATIDGDFIIELESRSEQIIDLKVNP